MREGMPATPPAMRYGLALGTNGLALLATLGFAPILGEAVFLFFFAAVMAGAWYGGVGPGLAAAAVAAALGSWLLIVEGLAPATVGMRAVFFLAVSAVIIGLNGARRLATAAAHAARERYEVTLSSIGDGVIVTDQHGLVTMLNPIAEALTGWPAAEAQGRPIGEVFRIINETSRAPVESPVERTLREGRIVGLANHTLLVARDGAERPIDDSGAPVRDRNGQIIGAVLVFRDISERRARERERDAAMAREQAARDAAQAAEQRATFLARASTLLSSSLQAEETLQAIARLAVSALADLCVVYLRTPDGLIRRSAAVHTDPEHEQELRAIQPAPIDPESSHPAAVAMRAGSALIDPPIADSVLAALSPDPERQSRLRALTPRSHMVVPLITRGAVVGAISLGRTSSDQPYSPADQLLAEELAQRAALAVDNARLYEDAQAAIRIRDRFLSLAAHELRTPLTAIQGNVQLARRQIARLAVAEERTDRALGLAVEQLRRLNEMITALLDVSRLEGGQLSLTLGEVDLSGLARRVIAQAEGSLAAHSLRCESPAGPLLIQGDAVRLEQVLANLLQNAVKYSPAGGPILVRVGQRDSRAFVAVADQGIGIPAEALPHLFERFYRAPSAEQGGVGGMGIGLFVVQEIVALHGGSVSVESTPGAGSTFTVWLPMAG